MHHLVAGGGVDHHPEGALMLGVVGQVDHPQPPGDAAPHPGKYRHIRRLHHGAVDGGLGGEGVDGDDGVGVDVADDGHVGGKGQGFDPPPEHPDARALGDAGGDHNHMVAQCTLIGGHRLARAQFLGHGRSFLLSVRVPTCPSCRRRRFSPRSGRRRCPIPRLRGWRRSRSPSPGQAATPGRRTGPNWRRWRR